MPWTEYLYARAMYRLTVLSYRSQGRGAASPACLTGKTGWPRSLRPLALTSTSVLRMTDRTQQRPSPPTSLVNQWAALLLRWPRQERVND